MVVDLLLFLVSGMVAVAVVVRLLPFLARVVFAAVLWLVWFFVWNAIQLARWSGHAFYDAVKANPNASDDPLEALSFPPTGRSD